MVGHSSVKDEDEEKALYHTKISTPSMPLVKSKTTIFWSCEVL